MEDLSIWNEELKSYVTRWIEKNFYSYCSTSVFGGRNGSFERRIRVIDNLQWIRTIRWSNQTAATRNTIGKLGGTYLLNKMRAAFVIKAN